MARLTVGEGQDEIDCGEYEFDVLPRVGERIAIRRDGKHTMLVADMIFHYPKPGPDAEPSKMTGGVIIRTRRLNPSGL